MAMFGRATRNDVLRSYTPTMAERIPVAVQGFLGRLGLNKYQARSFGQPIADVLGYSPVGAVAQSWDAGQAAARAPGMFGKAAALGGGMALAALGAVPGGKALARKGEALAMDEASRMARAAEQGFDTDIYHGTGSDIAEFNVGRRGLWATDRPEIADIYANASDSAAGGRDIRAQVANAGPNVMPLKLRGKVLEVSDQGPTGGGWSTDNIASALGVEMGSAGPRLPRLMQEAKDRGYSAVKITDMSDLGGQQTQWSILDPTQVRSKFAAFDPANRGSANLLAGLGAGAMLAPSMFGNRGGER